MSSLRLILRRRGFLICQEFIWELQWHAFQKFPCCQIHTVQHQIFIVLGIHQHLKNAVLLPGSHHLGAVHLQKRETFLLGQIVGAQNGAAAPVVSCHSEIESIVLHPYIFTVKHTLPKAFSAFRVAA